MLMDPANETWDSVTSCIVPEKGFITTSDSVGEYLLVTAKLVLQGVPNPPLTRCSNDKSVIQCCCMRARCSICRLCPFVRLGNWFILYPTELDIHEQIPLTVRSCIKRVIRKLASSLEKQVRGVKHYVDLVHRCIPYERCTLLFDRIIISHDFVRNLLDVYDSQFHMLETSTVDTLMISSFASILESVLLPVLNGAEHLGDVIPLHLQPLCGSAWKEAVEDRIRVREFLRKHSPSDLVDPRALGREPENSKSVWGSFVHQAIDAISDDIEDKYEDISFNLEQLCNGSLIFPSIKDILDHSLNEYVEQTQLRYHNRTVYVFWKENFARLHAFCFLHDSNVVESLTTVLDKFFMGGGLFLHSELASLGLVHGINVSINDLSQTTSNSFNLIKVFDTLEWSYASEGFSSFVPPYPVEFEALVDAPAMAIYRRSFKVLCAIEYGVHCARKPAKFLRDRKACLSFGQFQWKLNTCVSDIRQYYRCTMLCGMLKKLYEAVRHGSPYSEVAKNHETFLTELQRELFLIKETESILVNIVSLCKLCVEVRMTMERADLLDTPEEQVMTALKPRMVQFEELQSFLRRNLSKDIWSCFEDSSGF